MDLSNCCGLQTEMLAAVLVFYYLCMRVLQSYILGAAEWGLKSLSSNKAARQILT